MSTAANSSIRTTAALVALLFVSACYEYTPIEGGVSTVGREVVLELSEQGAIALAPQLGAQLQSVSGRVTGVSDDAYQVSVTQTNSRSGVETLWRGENASISRAYVASVGDRRLDKRRTWIVTGLAALGVALAGQAFGVNTGLDGLIGGRGRGSRQ
jgi:hypothetical protein